jgi:polysaccharide biosynthesis transport protein
MEFWAYYRLLRRRRWIIAATLLVAVGLAFVLNRRSASDYPAMAVLSMPSVQRFFFVTVTPATDATNLPKQEEINAHTVLALSRIRSREVAERVIRQLQLTVGPEELIRRIKAEKDPASNLVRVTATAATPQDAIILADAVAETAAAYDQEVQRRETTLAREFVEKQAAATRVDLQKAENALLEFQQAHGRELAAAKSSQAAALENDMRVTNMSLQEVQVKLAALLAELKNQKVVRSEQRIADNPIAQRLRAELVQLEVSLTSELAIHTDRYPGVIALKQKIEAITDRLRTELGRVVDQEQVKFNPVYDSLNQTRITLETERLALLARQEALQRSFETAQRELPGFTQKQLEQSRLTRNVEILSKQFSDLQAQVAQAQIRTQEAQNLGSLTVAEHARLAPAAPMSGLRFKLTVALILGLMGAVGLVFFMEYLDDTVRSPEQAERLLGVPALATIPRHNPPFDEAYRLLRINLGPHLKGDGAEAIVVTSARPRGGTSTVVTNLARAFARAGHRTIVVDTDLWRPTQHARFRVAKNQGLTDVFAGAISAQDALVDTGTPNLRLLPSGPSTADAGGLLGSQVMQRVLSDLKRIADVILLDAPPAGAFSDVLAMAPLASGVLLVLDAGRAPRGVDNQIKVQLERLGAKVLGVVLTRVRPDLVDSYYYQRFYKSVSRRRLAPAVAAAGVFIVLVGMGHLAGIAAKAGSHALDRWLFPAAQHTVVQPPVSGFHN